MSNNEIKITDDEARTWANNLSDTDKEELKRQALLKRAIDLAQPQKEPNWGGLSDEELRRETAKWGF